MFKAELKAETLKGLVYIVNTIVDEVKMAIHPDSIGMKAIDPSHVAMISIDVDKSAFISYEADEGDIGLDLDKIKSILKLAGPGDTIRMEHDPEQGRLTMTIGNIVRRMGLVDTSSLSDPKVPNVDLGLNLKIRHELLEKGVRAAESISDADHIQLSVDAAGFELSCSGDTDLASLKIPTAELEEGSKCDGTGHSMYPLDYFSAIVKVIPSEFVNVQFESDYPVKILFDLADGNAHVTYLLAPRIESE